LLMCKKILFRGFKKVVNLNFFGWDYSYDILSKRSSPDIFL